MGMMVADDTFLSAEGAAGRGKRQLLFSTGIFGLVDGDDGCR